MAADRETIKSASRATVVELAPPLGRRTVWELHHYERGQGVGRSLSPDADLPAWLHDLTASGRVIGLGWELRASGPQDAPDEWPRDYQRGRCGESRPATVEQIAARHKQGGGA